MIMTRGRRPKCRTAFSRYNCQGAPQDCDARPEALRRCKPVEAIHETDSEGCSSGRSGIAQDRTDTHS